MNNEQRLLKLLYLLADMVARKEEDVMFLEIQIDAIKKQLKKAEDEIKELKNETV